VEFFTDPGNVRAGAYVGEDAQMRVSRTGAVSFGAGDGTAQAARLTSATTQTDAGYIVEVRIDMLDHNAASPFLGLEYEVNDGSGGHRVSNIGWALNTGDAYQMTTRWGVGQLMPLVTPPPSCDAGTHLDADTNACVPDGVVGDFGAITAVPGPEPKFLAGDIVSYEGQLWVALTNVNGKGQTPGKNSKFWAPYAG
jgi:endo-1,4-beta-xylanase